MKRLAAFRLDQGGFLVRRSQPPYLKGFCLAPESRVPVIIQLLDSHVTS